jgi:hypothetical protein
MEHKTQTAILRSELAKNASAIMLDVVKAITKRSKLITGIALGASIPHQIVYLIAACVPYMNLSTSVEPVQLVQNYLDAFGMLIVAVAVPFGADVAIYSCIDAIGAEFATKKSKIRSFIFMTVPTGASGFVNFLAPAPMILKGLAAFLVLLIIIAQALRVFFETDWEKLERFESQNVIVIEEEVVETPKSRRRVVTEREKRARKRDLYDAMTSNEKYKWRIAWDAKEQARLEKEQLAQLSCELDEAIPVSPAPAGMNLNG